MQQAMSISEIKITKRTRVDLGDIAALAADIDEIGLLQPVVVSSDGVLIAGQRRIAAWRRSKYAKQQIPVYVIDLQAIARGEWSENVQRKSFTPSEAVALARLVEPILRAEGKRRQAHGVTAPGKSKENTSQSKRHITRDLLAAHCGVSAKTLQKAFAVVSAAERDPAQFGYAAKKMDESGNVDAAYRAVLAPSTRRMLTQDMIFRTTKIGNVPLGDFTAPELRWFIGFFAELGDLIGRPSSDAINASELFKPAEVGRAIKSGERMRGAA